MATQLQELQAKRKELQATNPNASMLDARNALTPAISNAPVAGQPPATPPVTPTPSVHDMAQLGTAGTEAINQAQRQANIAKRQEMITSGQVPQVGTQATPEQVPQIVQQAEANKQMNLQKEMPLSSEFQNGNTEVKAPTTQTATTTPKQEVVPPPPTDRNGIFNALATGQQVTPTNTPEYRKAKASFDNYQKFSGMSKQQFIDSIKQGQITTELNSQLASNPNFQEAKAEVDKINRANGINTMISNISQGLSGQTIPTPDYFETISANLIKKYGLTTGESQNAFKQIVSQDEDVVKSTRELAEINRQVAETTQLINDGYKEMRAKYQGKLSATQLISYMDNRFRSATDTLNALNTQRQYVEADLKTATDMAINEYNAFQKDLADRNAIRNTLIQSELGLATKSAEMQMEAELGLATKSAEMQMEADFAKRQAYENLNDPATAISNMMAMYQQKGIPFTQSLQTKLSEFANSGLTLGQYLDQMTKDIQAKPEYKALTATKPTTTAEWKVIGKNADGSDRYGLVDATKGTITPYFPGQGASGDLRGLANQFPGQAWAKNNNPAGITWNANFDNGTGTAKLLQDAGIAYSKGTPRPAGEGGNYVTFNTIEDGLKAQQIIMTQTYGNKSVGEMLSSWVGTAEGPNYAQQVAGMAGIADLNQKVSSLAPEQLGRLQMAKIQKESPGLYELLSQPTQATPVSQYTDQNVSDLAYLVELQEKNPTQASKEMKELGYTSRDLANYKGGNVPLTDRQKQSSINLANSIKDLLTNYDYTDATGVHFFDEAPRGSDWASAEEKIKTIVANMTLPNLGMLKGPMSDKDLAFIQAASSNLSTAQSDSAFGKQLLDAYNLAARRAGLPEAKTLGDITKEATTTTNSGAGQTVSGAKGNYIVTPQ